MKYETVPMIKGIGRSCLFEISLSLPLLSAQYKIMAIGSIDAKIMEINSNNGNCHKLLIDNVKQIIMNNGIHIIGGLVNVETVFANLNFEFMIIV